MTPLDRQATLLEVAQLKAGLLDDAEAAQVRERLERFGDPGEGLSDDRAVLARHPADAFLHGVRQRAGVRARRRPQVGLVAALAVAAGAAFVLWPGQGSDPVVAPQVAVAPLPTVSPASPASPASPESPASPASPRIPGSETPTSPGAAPSPAGSPFDVVVQHSTPWAVTVTAVEGTVRWSGGGAPVQLAVGAALPAGVLTSEAGRADLAFADGTVVRLAAASTLAVRDDGQKLLELTAGELWTSVAPQSPGTPLQIQTPAASLEVLGTRFTVTADAAMTRLSVEEGLVAISRRADGQAARIPAGHEVVVRAVDRTPLAVVAPGTPTGAELSLELGPRDRHRIVPVGAEALLVSWTLDGTGSLSTLTLLGAGLEAGASHEVRLEGRPELVAAASDRRRAALLFAGARGPWQLLTWAAGAAPTVSELARPELKQVLGATLAGDDLHLLAVVGKGGAVLHHRLGGSGFTPVPGVAYHLPADGLPPSLRLTAEGVVAEGLTRSGDVLTLRRVRIEGQRARDAEDLTVPGGEARSAHRLALPAGQEVVIGTFADRPQQTGSEGLYLRLPSGAVRLHRYGDLPNAMAHHDDGRQQRLAAKARRLEAGAAALSVDHFMEIVEVRWVGDRLVVVAEAAWRDYAVQPPKPDGSVPGVEFIGHRYSHALVVAFDLDGSVAWSHNLPMGDLWLPERRRVVAATFSGDRVTLAYNRGDAVVSLTLEGGDVVQARHERALGAPGERLIDLRERHAMPWHDTHLWVWGEQTVRVVGEPRQRRFHLEELPLP